jgi:tetratricopeptide (TPR) repeat protein
LNLALSEAYSAYRQGDSKRAEEQYRIAMELAPNNTDALLGSAAVAMTLQRYHQALSFYQKVLEKSPQDEYAQSGILSLAAIEQVTPELVSRVNILIKQFPNSSHLYFLQGSLHAIAQQWHAAQTSFFNAWSRQPKRSDYAYNLAIALDHIQQYKEALRFYKQSLSSDMESPILLNGNDIQQRIQQLEAMNE